MKQLLLASCSLILMLSHPAWGAEHEQPFLSVCDVAVFDERYDSHTVTIKAVTGATQDGYGFYLRDEKCANRYVAVEFPLGAPKESGIEKLIDVWRPRNVGDPDPALGKRVYCICTGKIHYDHSPTNWSPVMQIESVQRVWFEEP
jgi:hypothetical protein